MSWEDQNEICGATKEIDVNSLYWSPEATYLGFTRNCNCSFQNLYRIHEPDRRM